jgi:hypothetical protein
MGTYSGPLNPVDGLIYHIDPANPRSYSGVGTIIYDMSGNNNISYFTNGAFYQNYQKGVVLVDGNNDYISTPVFNLTSPITVSAWVKNVADDAPVFSTSGVGVYGNGEVIHYFSGKSILIAGGGSPNKYFQFPQLNLNSWVHLTMTRDVSNNMRVYLNGIGSTSNPQSNPSILQINQIGRYSSFTNIYNLKGSIGEVKIYNRDLSAAEVLQNYNSTKKRYVPEENIVTNGLVLHLDAANYSCYVGTGITSNSLVGGIAGTLVNGTGFSAIGGGAFFFDGTNDYINLGNSSVLKPTVLSVGCYFKINTIGAVHVIVGKQGPGAGAASYAIVVQSGKLHFRICNSSGTEYNASSDFSDSTNYNYALGTYDGSTIRLYLNGASIASSTVGISIGYSDSYPLKVGYYGEAIPVNMNVSVLNIYNRVLSAKEIEQNYNALRGRYNI